MKYQNTKQIEAFIELINAEIKYYNTYCIKGFEITLEDVIKQIMKNKKK